jgi:nephrocystin-3
MNDEREHLVKHIFPELRLWCEERKLRLIECDLRWGVPKNADTRQTLLACLSEIDRCINLKFVLLDVSPVGQNTL